MACRCGPWYSYIQGSRCEATMAKFLSIARNSRALPGNDWMVVVLPMLQQTVGKKEVKKEVKIKFTFLSSSFFFMIEKEKMEATEQGN